MPGIVALVSAISNDVVAALAAASLPPLTDGQIVLGKSRRYDTSFAPRIIFIPRGSRFEPKSGGANVQPIVTTNAQAPGSRVRSYTMTQFGGGYSASPTITMSLPDIAGGTRATAAAIVRNGSIVKIVPVNVGSGYVNPPTVTITDSTGSNAAATANLAPTPAALAAIQQRELLTEWVQFEVRVWGVSGTSGAVVPDVNADYDATQALYQQVIASTHLLVPGRYRVTGGRWIDAQDDANIVDVVGHDFTFGLEIATPLMDQALQFAPVNTQPNPTNYLIPFNGGAQEQGSSG
jgi:hypothetical protein